MKDLNLMRTKSTWKECIFSAYEHVMELNIVGPYSYLILLLIEAMQLLYIPFSLQQDSDDAYSYLGTTFKVFLYVPYLLDTVGETAFFYVWVCHAFFLTLTFALLMFVVLSYQTSQSKPSFIGKILIQMLSLFLVFFKTILALPSTIVFFVPILCTNGYTCWTGTNTAISVLSVVFQALNFVVLIANSLYVDSHVQSGLPWAGPNAKMAGGVMLYKFLVGFYIAADAKFSAGVYIGLLLIATSGYLSYNEYAGKHIYSGMISCGQCIKVVLYFWCMLEMYITKLISISVGIDLGAFCIVAGIFVGVVVFIMQQQNVMEALKGDITTSRNEADAVNAMALLAELPNQFKKNPSAAWLLIGVLNLHKTGCRNEACVCHSLSSRNAKGLSSDRLNGKLGDVTSPRSPRYNAVATMGSGVFSNYEAVTPVPSSATPTPKEETEQQKQERGQPVRSMQPWTVFLGVIFDDIVAVFPKSVDARLMVAYYHELMSKNFYKAFFQILKVSDADCGYGQQLGTHRMKVLLNKAICNYESAQSSTTIDLDLNTYVKFESKRRELEWSMQDCTQKVMQFWGLLLSVNLKIDKMYMLGGQISCALQRTHEIFTEITQIFPDHIKTYMNYATFLREVANNEIESEEYQDKAEQITRNLDLGKGQNYSENSIFSINRETAIVIISGNQNNLATILHANEYMQEFFGYSYNNLVGFSINRIMPKLVATMHNKFLTQFFETGNHSLINCERLLFGQSKFGLLVPVALLVKTMPGIEDGVRYIGFIRRDLNYIKRNLIKLPYQYQKNRQLGFIMTDCKDNVVSISEYAAKTLGIPLSYFEKKKSLLTDTFNISRLNRRLGSAEDEEELKKGGVVEIHSTQIFEMIDKDFLTPDEVTTMEKSSYATVYIQLLTFDFSFGVKYKIYIMVSLKNVVSNMALEDLKDEESANPNLGLIEAFGESMSSAASSAAGINDKLRPLYKELKKNSFERNEPRHIVLVKRVIYATLFVLFALSLVDLIYYAITLTGINSLFKLDETAHYRRNLMQTMLEEFQSYRDLAVGNEAALSTYEADRKGQLQTDLNAYLERIKDNEYKFQERLKDTSLSTKVNLICMDPGVNYVEMFIDSTSQFSVQGLGITIIQIVSKVNRIINEASISELDTDFVENIYNKTPAETSKLTQTEKDAYFVIANGLYNMMNASTQVIDYVKTEYDNKMSSEKLLYYILHIVRWVIYAIMIVVTVPIIQKVQSGKRAILQFFAEVPKKRIETILKECEAFYYKQQNFLNIATKDDNLQQNKDNDKHESDKNLGASLSNSMNVRNGTTTPLIAGGNIGKPSNEQKTPPPENQGEPEAKDLDPTAENADSQDEESFKEGRKKKFMAYKAGIGLIFLLFIGAMLMVAAYQCGIFAMQVKSDSMFSDNYDLVQLIQQRWYYLASTMVFFLSSTKTYQITVSGSTTGQSVFDFCSEKTLSTEDSINTAIASHPSNQDSVITILTDLAEESFCASFISSSDIAFPRSLTNAWCLGIKGGILEHGIRTVVFFLLTELKTLFLTELSGATLSANDTSLLNDKLVFEYVLVPTFDYVVGKATARQYKLVNDTMIIFIMNYVAMFAVMLIALLVLIKYFANKLNTELWNAKGIVTLLPLDLIEKNKNIRDLFSQQMNVIL